MGRPPWEPRLRGCFLLVEAFGDGVRDSVSPQVAAVSAGGVGLVGQDVIGTAAGSSDAHAGHGNLVQDARELGAVTVVPWCQQEGEGPASSVGGEVDFGGEVATGASQALAELTTSSSRTTSFRSTGSTWFVPWPTPV